MKLLRNSCSADTPVRVPATDQPRVPRPNLRVPNPCRALCGKGGNFPVLALLFLAILSTSACRLDMHIQPRYNPLAKSDFFPDERAGALSSMAQWPVATSAPTPISTP